MGPGVWKWGYTKKRTLLMTLNLPKAFQQRRTCKFGEESRGPLFPMNMNLGFAAMQFPAVLAGLLQSLLRRYSVMFSMLPPPQPILFPCHFGGITRPIFSKSGVRTPRPPWLQQWLDSRMKQRGPRERYIPRASIWLSTGLNVTVEITASKQAQVWQLLDNVRQKTGH